VISHEICAVAGVSADSLSERETMVRGRSMPLHVHPIEQADQITLLGVVSETA
jgi:hypothetical protein